MNLTNEIYEKLKCFKENENLLEIRYRFNEPVESYKIYESKDSLENELIGLVLIYLAYLSSSAEVYFQSVFMKDASNTDKIDISIMNEINQSSKDSLVCQYSALVAYFLLNTLLDKERTIEFVQGFVMFDGESFITRLIPAYAFNYHAFITIDDVVHDPTSYQFEYVMRENTQPFVWGPISPCITYVGCPDSYQTIEKIYAQHTNVELSEWTFKHMEQMENLRQSGELHRYFNENVMGSI